jgi:hypothetical protein
MLIISALGGGSLVASACNRTPDEARKDGIEAQQEATAKIRDNKQEAQKAITEAQQEATKKTAAANENTKQVTDEANKKVADAEQANRYGNAQAQAKANVEIREANREVGADTAELRMWGQKKIDDLNNRIDSARVKAQKSTPKAQTKFDVAMKGVQAKRDELASEIASIEEPGARTPADFKAHFDTEVTRLENRIDTVSQSL